MPVLTIGLSFLLSLIFTPIVRSVGIRLKIVSTPREDRWNRGVIPILGGVSIFIAFALSLTFTGQNAILNNSWILIGASLIFLLGLYDDIRELSPPVKLIFQIIIASVVVFSGVRTGFFDSDLLNILVSVTWMVLITNAVNLLDNMDGLAGGIIFIAAGFMGFFFWRSGADPSLLFVSAALFGSILGFLVFNFPPAKIFMGDSGSLFLGFSLAAVAIARTPQASNVLAVLGVPALILTLPIIDTLFVTITRLLRGQSPAKGGRDHTSHRLVAFGLSERQTVLVLYGIAILAGAVGALVESFDYTLSIVLIPILLVVFSILAAYLSRLRVVETENSTGPIVNFMERITYGRRLFEIGLDFFLISIAYYLSFLVLGGFSIDEPTIDLYIQTLPIIIGAAYVSFFLLGIYQRVWQYLQLRDLFRYGWAVFFTTLISGVAFTLLFPGSKITAGTLFIFAVFLFVAISAARSSFRLLDEISPKTHKNDESEEHNILIFNNGENVEFVFSWLKMGAQVKFKALGFIDDAPYTKGRRIQNVEILGQIADAADIIKALSIEGIIIPPNPEITAVPDKLLAVCKAEGIWVKQLTISLDNLQ